MVILQTPYMPVKASEILRDDNFWDDKHETGSLVNLVCGNLQLLDELTIKATAWEASVPNLDYFTNRKSPWRIPSPTAYEFQLVRDPMHCSLARWQQIARSSLVLFRQVFYASNDPLRAEMTRDTVVVIWDDAELTPNCHLELF